MSEIELDQVLLLSNPGAYRALGPALWSALEEASSLFQAGGATLRVKRIFLSPSDPIGFDAPAPLPAAASAIRAKVWEKAAGQLSGVYDQLRLLRLVRELLSIPSGRALLIVFDREITPPPEWRYIIWDGSGNDAIVAVPPVDPRHWGVRDERRAATIKHRVRGACLSILGSWHGLGRCTNPTCIMYGQVDSANCLDVMTHVGAEHSEFPSLAGKGYRRRLSADPSNVQPIESFNTGSSAASRSPTPPPASKGTSEVAQVAEHLGSEPESFDIGDIEDALDEEE